MNQTEASSAEVWFVQKTNWNTVHSLVSLKKYSKQFCCYCTILTMTHGGASMNMKAQEAYTLMLKSLGSLHF